MRNRAAILFLLAAAVVARGQDTNFAFRVPCEVQTADTDSLPELVWLQGSTPLIQAVPMKLGKALAADSNTTVRMVIGESVTGTNYAVVTNVTISGNTSGYWMQWPTIGTNSAGTGTTAQAWFYSILFERESRSYWNGSGKLYIEPADFTGTNGLVWQSYVDGGLRGVILNGVTSTVANGYASLTVDSTLDTTARAAASNAQATANGAYAAVSNLPAIPTNAAGIAALGGIVGATITGGTVTTNAGVLAFAVEGGGGETSMTNVVAPFTAGPPGVKSFALWASDGVSKLSLSNSSANSAAFAFLSLTPTPGVDSFILGRAGSPVWTNIPWTRIDETNIWAGRINDTESARIAALASGSGATQLIINVAGHAATTSTYDDGTATLTVTDLAAPSGGGTTTNAAIPTIISVANGGTYAIAPVATAHYFINLTNATQTINLTNFVAASSADLLIEIRSTNSLTMKADGVDISGWATSVALSTNTIRTLWSKPYLMTNWTATQL